MVRMNEQERRASELRAIVFDILGRSRRQPTPRQLVRELKRECPSCSRPLPASSLSMMRCRRCDFW